MYIYALMVGVNYSLKLYLANMLLLNYADIQISRFTNNTL
ncbi:MAG: hypothetical protein ACI8QG_000165 [Flavobacteriales bacterium]|jgi:hypothetical protein